MTAAGWRILIAGVVLVLTSLVQARAQEQPVEGIAEVSTNALGALTRASPRGAMEPARVYFRGNAMRIEFTDSRGTPYSMLLPDAGTVGWILDGRGAMPVPHLALPVRLDVDAPCGKGMLADCKRVGTGLRAGRDAVQWRYRLPGNTGPGRTRRGTLWLDADTGLVLEYSGDGGLGPPRQWRVGAIDYQHVADGLFEVPADALQPQPTLRR